MKPDVELCLKVNWIAGFAIVLVFISCHNGRDRSEKSFGEIYRLVTGKTSAEVLHLLGEPDSRTSIFGGGEKWIWWNYTFLEGKDYPPEFRGKTVHLEIVFTNPERSYSQQWRVDGTLAVDYQMPLSGG